MGLLQDPTVPRLNAAADGGSRTERHTGCGLFRESGWLLLWWNGTVLAVWDDPEDGAFEPYA